MARSSDDVPLPLGAHLDDLRRRLFWPVGTFLLSFIVGFIFQTDLMRLMVRPLVVAITMDGVRDDAAKLGLPTDGSYRVLQVLDMAESATSAAWVACYLAIALTVPVLLYHLWQFVAVGLKPKERRLVFLFLPAGVICFYIGCVLGYLFALPWFYAFLISFTAYNPVIKVEGFRLSEYVDFFFMWTIAFGAVMDIPWAIVCIVRTGLVKPETIAGSRRYVIMINIVLAAVITPGSDLASLLALFIPMQVLFELGLFLSRFFRPPAKIDER